MTQRCRHPVKSRRRPPVSAPVTTGWTALVTADREFYERVLARGGPDTVEFPQFFPERRITLWRATNVDRTPQPRTGRRTRDRPRHPPR